MRSCSTSQRFPLCRLAPFVQLLPALAMLLIVLAPSVQASQSPQPPTLDEINAVARELYCPLCNGVRLDTCELQACAQMRDVIADRLAAGVPKEEIKAEFVTQYGPVVLGEPPREGLDLVIWILPVAALLAGAVWLFYTARRWSRQSALAAQGTPTDASPLTGESKQTADTTDPYLARIESDLAGLD